MKHSWFALVIIMGLCATHKLTVRPVKVGDEGMSEMRVLSLNNS